MCVCVAADCCCLCLLTQGVLVKVYEVNAWNYYTSEGRQVELSLELSGLAPSKTLALQTPQNPVIRYELAHLPSLLRSKLGANWVQSAPCFIHHCWNIPNVHLTFTTA